MSAGQCTHVHTLLKVVLFTEFTALWLCSFTLVLCVLWRPLSSSTATVSTSPLPPAWPQGTRAHVLPEHGLSTP